ncbi:3-methyladenine DNA glycosylase [Luteolibacter algae]|uniref:3-methyladenine DNA glycosylase n=1 Tax=Luteolibacter algae TaxID=454151 RepID=A0ABW5DDJ4_9BACT
MNSLNIQNDIVPFNVWEKQASEHFQKASKFTASVRKRRDCGESHPVEDFLFDYYPYPLSIIEQWHPEIGVRLEIGDVITLPKRFSGKRYSHRDRTFFLDRGKMEEKERARLLWIQELLMATQRHTPNFACHGLHEWAMVYQAEEIRHSGLAPLRLKQEEIDSLIESRSITCTHHDAFRFFAKAARPLNKIQPSIDTRLENEQPGCVHANMDLYKWAAKCMPWIGSGLLLECFLLANELRNLDMRASPYDLSKWQVIPIKIETAEGRKHYETEQRRLAAIAGELRGKLIASLDRVL